MPALQDTRLGRNREFDHIVGTNVRTLRLQKDVTQQVLADAVDMDFTQLSRVESGTRSLKFREAIAIANKLGVSPRKLSEPISE